MTNDAWTPLRAARRYGAPVEERRPRRFSRTRAAGDDVDAGPLVAHRRGSSRRPSTGARSRSSCSSGRGSSTRDGVRGEGIPGGYGAVYGELRALETIGACRRGYFVEGLGGAQFALPGAVERLRELRGGRRGRRRSCSRRPTRRSRTARRCPGRERAGARAARVAGAHVVLLGGAAALFVERGGRTLVPLREPEDAWLRPALTRSSRTGCATGTRSDSR